MPHDTDPGWRPVGDSNPCYRRARLDTRTTRLKLAPRREPYWRVIQEGRAVGYRRIAGRAGTWIARHYSPAAGRSYQALGSADDTMEADGSATLTFAQAQDAAVAWFAELRPVCRQDREARHGARGRCEQVQNRNATWG